MGNQSSSISLKDQQRFSVTGLTVTTSSRTILTISPNAYPATNFTVRRPDNAPVEYIQDLESGAFLLKLPNDEELTFNFTIVLRQGEGPSETQINGLTFLVAGRTRELDALITRELHADPNLHKNNPNVSFIGDFTTGGSPSVQFPWAWKWKPPRPSEDRGGGWRTCCSFVEYDQRNHRFQPLANFNFYIPPAPLQQINSYMSDSDVGEVRDYAQQQSPTIDPIAEDSLDLVPSFTGTTINAGKVDVACQRPGDDVSALEDGPLFRTTMKAMEQKTGSMKQRWKKVLQMAKIAYEASIENNNAQAGLMEALRGASSSNANAVQPAIEHYFDKIAKQILQYEKSNPINLQKLIIDPISRLYNTDIKQAESKKKDFDEETKEYYNYVSRYLNQRPDVLKEKKRDEADSKYQKKRRDFELKRFDYSSYLQDLHGGRKDQEVLSGLTRYADTQAKGFLATASKIESLLPQLEALNSEVKEADKEFQLHRTEREEKRRTLEKTNAYSEPSRAYVPQQAQQPSTPAHDSSLRRGASNAARSISTTLRHASDHAADRLNVSSPSVAIPSSTQILSPVPSSQTTLSSSGSPSHTNKFKGFRDLEENDNTPLPTDGSGSQHRKEGFLWALSKPGTHADPKGLHKFWVVLDQGKLSESTNWKGKLELHMPPIDLRTASVREARNAERRFCFEIITPQVHRVYHAPTEEEMRNWITTLNNALQNTIEGKDEAQPRGSTGSINRDIVSALTGKSASTSYRRGYSGNSKTVIRHATTGHSERSSNTHVVTPEISDASKQLLQQIRSVDVGNTVCADCNSENKVDWVSINLGIIICIECSGIHRSLGTHISKVRSLTLDSKTFTQDVVEIFLTLGNRISNTIWEATLDASLKPTPQATREQRLRFITAKYVDKAYVQPLSPTLSHYPTADETLLASIKKNDVENVLYALALGGDPNVHDRSRNTHAIFLALAAADPATPASLAASAPTPRSASPKPPGSPNPAARKPFTTAELLFLNGATPPAAEKSPIPLSAQARQYLQMKDEQRGGIKKVP
ncbi:ArfGap-domain-containing protein [Tothia fuscella]|uniref:ADP-ribosylation factor GTPase-activating protein n=1 Tax=Tothia fuscella TaxID=1048955 RepID=A0A9P4NRB9_9PEZI|nr:ArfGap-domain-containing protein [Tothia fuscella]